MAEQATDDNQQCYSTGCASESEMSYFESCIPQPLQTRTILQISAKTLSKDRRKNSSAVAQGLALNDWGHWNSKATEMSNSSLCMRGQWHPQEICEHLPLTSREIGWNMSPVARFGKGSGPLYQCSAGSPLLQHFTSLGQVSSLRLKPAMPALPHCQPARPSTEKTTLTHGRAPTYYACSLSAI